MRLLDTLPHTLYRFFDDTGRLLYVGIAVDFLARWRKHRKKQWWPLVVRMEIEHHPTRQAALAAERQAIIVERPLHNRQHNRAVWGDRLQPTMTQRVDAWFDAFICSPWNRTGTVMRLVKLAFALFQATGAWTVSLLILAVGGPAVGLASYLIMMIGVAYLTARMVGGFRGYLLVPPQPVRPAGYWRRRVVRAVLIR